VPKACRLNLSFTRNGNLSTFMFKLLILLVITVTVIRKYENKILKLTVYYWYIHSTNVDQNVQHTFIYINKCIYYFPKLVTAQINETHSKYQFKYKFEKMRGEVCFALNLALGWFLCKEKIKMSTYKNISEF
jgi:hypothetical protein